MLTLPLWRLTDVGFWSPYLTTKYQNLTSMWRWLKTLVRRWILVTLQHNLKTTKYQRQLTSVLDVNLTLSLDVGLTLNFGHLTSRPKSNLISTSYDVVCLLGLFNLALWFKLYFSFRESYDLILIWSIVINQNVQLIPYLTIVQRLVRFQYIWEILFILVATI